VGEGIAVGCSLAAIGLSFFVLTRTPLASFQRDIKTSMKKLEREWDDYQERLESTAGRVAKQRGLLEKVKKAEVAEVFPAVAVERHRSRARLFSDWKVKNAKPDSDGSSQPRGPDIRGDRQATEPGS